MVVLPLTLGDYQDFEMAVRDFAGEAVYPINESITNYPVVIKGRSIEEGQLEGVAKWIRSLGFLKEFSTMGWVPRFSMNFYGVGNDIDVFPIMSAESSRVGLLTDGYGVIDGPVPPFETSGAIDQHWSMDVSFYASRDTRACYRLPWLNSHCDALVSHKIGHGSELNASRVSKRGFVVQHQADQGDIRISPIAPKEVVKAFLEGVGIRYLQTSNSGLALQRIIEELGGLRGCDLFQNSAIRELLGSLSTGKWKRAREVRGAVQRSLAGLSIFGRPATKEEITARTESILSQAVEAKVFRIGLEFQCSRCKRHNWYAVSEFNDGYNCKSCFARESTPRLDATTWNYMSDGFYRSTNKLDGNITVLLALNCIDHVLEHHMHCVPSFDYSDDSGPHEMDFGIIASELMGGEVDLIFGEAKSGPTSATRSVRKSKPLGKRPDPICVSPRWLKISTRPTRPSSVSWSIRSSR